MKQIGKPFILPGFLFLCADYFAQKSAAVQKIDKNMSDNSSQQIATNVIVDGATTGRVSESAYSINFGNGMVIPAPVSSSNTITVKFNNIISRGPINLPRWVLNVTVDQ